MKIESYLPAEQSFSRSIVDAMQAAYSQALEAVEARDGPHLVRDIIARRIVNAAIEGEVEAKRLCDAALASLGVKR